MRTRVHLVVASLTACAALLSAVSAAAAEHARLQVTRDPSARDCPDDRGVRDAVGARLGYEPFVDDAPRRVVVTYSRDGGELRGTVRLEDENGEVRGERALTSARGDCDELASSTTLTISILLDPRSGLVPPRPREAVLAPEGLAPPGSDAARPPAPPPPPVPSRPVQLRVSLAAAASLGSAPAPAAAAILGVGVGRDAWSVTGELRAEAPASGAESPGGAARTAYTAGNLVPCGHLRVLYGCFLVALGALRGEVLGASPSRQSTFHALLGPRVGVALPVATWLALDAHVEGTYALTSTSLRVEGREVWSTPALSGLGAVGVVGRLP